MPTIDKPSQYLGGFRGDYLFFLARHASERLITNQPAQPILITHKPLSNHLTLCAKIPIVMDDLTNNSQVAETQSLRVVDPSASRVPQNRTSTGQFVPGQSGNPGGRPKKLTRHLDKLLDEPYNKHDTYAQAVVKAALRRAIKKSDFATKEIWERAEGKVPQAVTGANGGPMQIQVAVMYRSADSEPDEGE